MSVHTLFKSMRTGGGDFDKQLHKHRVPSKPQSDCCLNILKKRNLYYGHCLTNFLAECKVYWYMQCNSYITDLDVTRWCCKNASKHAIGDVSNEESCPICLDPLVHDSKVLKLLCGHTMHLECADKWFVTCIMSAKAAKCPLCNLVVLRPVFKRVSEADFPNRIVTNTSSFSRLREYILRMARRL